MISEEFAHVETWVFDLDNTLYPPSARLFDQIEVLMTDFVMTALGVDRERANFLRSHYWETHGTTLAGLMREHDVDPGPYLDHVHDISLEHLEHEPALAAQIEALPGRKIIYTNGPQIHAERVTAARGLAGLFDAIYGVEHAEFRPKPEREAFEMIFRLDGLDASRAAMFEDDHRNLIAPKAMGMRCILVGPAHETPLEHIQYQTEDLAHFLSQITSKTFPSDG